MKPYGSHVVRWKGIGEPVEREPTCECVASSKLVDGPTQEVSTPPHAPSVKGPQSKKGGLPSELAHSRRPTGWYQVVVKQRDNVSCCKEGYLKLYEMLTFHVQRYSEVT